MFFRPAAAFLLAAIQLGAAHIPTVDELIRVKSASATEISPNGKQVAYVVTEADFEQDAFVTQIWLADVAQN